MSQTLRFLLLLFICVISATVLAEPEAESKTGQTDIQPDFPSQMLISYINHEAVSQYYKPIIDAAYAKLGIKVEYTATSVARVEELFLRQLLDADVVRGDHFFANNPHVIRVGPNLGKVSVYLVCQITIKCHPSAMIGRHVGVLGTLEQYDGLVIADVMYITHTDSQQKLLELFTLGRIDYFFHFIVLNDRFNYIIEHPHNSTFLQQLNTYHAIHKRFSHIAPRLAEEISISYENMQKQLR